MTEFEIASIKRQWDAGVPICQIIKTMPYKKRTAEYKIGKLRADGTLPEREKRNGRKLVVEAYNSGIKNPYEIADIYGYAPRSVQIWLADAKLGRERPSRNWKKIDNSEKTKKIIACLENGARVNETARQFGVSKQWVSQIKQRIEKERADADRY